MKNTYRLTPDIILQMDRGNTNYKNFFNYRVDGSAFTQYLEATNTFPDDASNYTVWNFGEYESRINKVFNMTALVDAIDFDGFTSRRYYPCNLVLRQGFSWSGIFGLLVVVKGMKNNDVLLSRIFTINDFKLDANNSKELIDNAFWVANCVFNIPRFDDDNMMVYVEPIPFGDIISDGPSIGTITTYPDGNNDYEPLVSEEPTPAFIQCKLEVDDNLWLNIQPVTLEIGKTLEKSLYDYFGYNDQQIVPVEISHIIKYGTANAGYRTLRLSNEDNIYGPIRFGLDFSVFPVNTVVEIFLSTEFVVNGKLMKREVQILFNYSNALNPALNQYLPAGEEYQVYPVTVVKENVINQNVINTASEQKIVTIIQPIFMEIVSKDISYDNKNVSFENINRQCYMVIKPTGNGNNQYLKSEYTADGKYYFPLNKISKPAENTEFNILDSETDLLMLTGKFI